MTLIKSISGIRGTIGGNPEDGLNPLAIVKFVAAYATFIKKNTKVTTNKIVVGRMHVSPVRWLNKSFSVRLREWALTW